MEADVKYHALAPDESLFHVLEDQGVIEYPPGWDAELEHRALTEPPDDSRAALRGWCIGRFASEMRAANWSVMNFAKDALTMRALTGPSPAAMAEIRSRCDTPKAVIDAVADLENSAAPLGYGHAVASGRPITLSQMEKHP